MFANGSPPKNGSDKAVDSFYRLDNVDYNLPQPNYNLSQPDYNLPQPNYNLDKNKGKKPDNKKGGSNSGGDRIKREQT